MYDRNKTVWGSHDGREQLIKDIPQAHFVNILNWVKSRTKTYPGGLFEFLEEEAELRKLVAFTENKPYPQKLSTGYYELRNISWARKSYNYCKLLIIRRKIAKITGKKG